MRGAAGSSRGTSRSGITGQTRDAVTNKTSEDCKTATKNFTSVELLALPEKLKGNSFGWALPTGKQPGFIIFPEFSPRFAFDKFLIQETGKADPVAAEIFYVQGPDNARDQIQKYRQLVVRRIRTTHVLFETLNKLHANQQIEATGSVTFDDLHLQFLTWQEVSDILVAYHVSPAYLADMNAHAALMGAAADANPPGPHSVQPSLRNTVIIVSLAHAVGFVIGRRSR